MDCRITILYTETNIELYTEINNNNNDNKIKIKVKQTFLILRECPFVFGTFREVPGDLPQQRDQRGSFILDMPWVWARGRMGCLSQNGLIPEGRGHSSSL